MKGRESFNSSEHSACKMFYACDETSGPSMTDSVTGARVLNTSPNSCMPYDPPITHEVPNAISKNMLKTFVIPQ